LGFLRGWKANAVDYPAILRRQCQCFSELSVQAHVDDGALLDLLEPRVEPRVELLAEEDLADLSPHAAEPLALQRLLRLEAEDVIAERGAIRRRDLPGRQAEDLRFD